MEQKTVIQNIFGTVHGHVVGGNVTQASPQPASKDQLRAYIRQMKQDRFKAQLGCYMNAPMVLMLPLVVYLGFQTLMLLQSLTQIHQSPQLLQAQMIQMGVLIGALLLLSRWQLNIRRKHTRTIQYTTHQIDRAELELHFNRR